MAEQDDPNEHGTHSKLNAMLADRAFADISNITRIALDHYTVRQCLPGLERFITVRLEAVKPGVSARQQDIHLDIMETVDETQQNHAWYQLAPDGQLLETGDAIGDPLDREAVISALSRSFELFSNAWPIIIAGEKANRDEGHNERNAGLTSEQRLRIGNNATIADIKADQLSGLNRDGQDTVYALTGDAQKINRIRFAAALFLRQTK